ncbi:putative nonribosomal peptide synthase [Xylariaceae sp. AK1471]|nr:putative nonribosomal peptide synthase [Xylariaceae sp. AK1471]
MISHDDIKMSYPVKAAHLNGLAVNNTDNAAKYWQTAFRSLGPQPRLPCFPLEYQWPRSETTVTAADGLLETALQFCRKHDVSLHAFLYGIWAIVSMRHMTGGQLTTAFTVDGGDQSSFGQDGEIEPADHAFPLLLTVLRDMDALSWIRHVRKVNAEASSHAHIGYKQIIKTASAYDPQVKVSVNWEQYSQDVVTTDAEFPLVLNLSVSTKFRLSLRHNSTVHKMDARILLDHFAATLHEVIEAPHSTISELPIMSSTERQLVQEYGKAALRPRGGLIHHLIEQRARLMPDADALQFEVDKPLTFSMLNRRSNQLARQIRRYGASVVPVHMHISATLIVSLLAILKAGAAYVILDPDAGAARRSYIINDVEAEFVLVDESTAGEFHKEFEVEDLLRQSMSNDDSDLITDQAASDPAYIIYTSGSSGNPKGVLLEHQAAFNGLLAFPKVAKLRQLLFYNPVFSAAQRSIWATLSVGGCLCLASKENLTVHLTTMINTMQINSIDMTSTTAALLSPDSVPSLVRLVLGGEMVNSTVIQKWAHRVELFSSYGLSECTQLNWRNRLLRDTDARNIGQPFDTTTSYILTPGTTSLSPLLIPGELCLGGAQLARTYMNLPEETEKSFIQNTFGKGRLYRTGDMAVRHADGSIEMIGRIDFQIKINGQRVDPGEPNSLIQAHQDVENSAVVPVLVNKKMLLVAVVVSRAGSDWDSLVESLRSSLPSRIPLYMIPSFWVPISALPLNPNGKVNMASVRDVVEGLRDSGQLLPDRARTDIDGSTFTHNENIIRGLWAEYLSLPESYISLEDSFLSLGGTSLEAIQVVSKLRSEHALILQVEDIILGNSLSRIASVAQKQAEELNNDTHATPFELLREPLSLEDLSIGYSEVEDAFPVTPFQEAAIANTIMGGKTYIYSRSYSFSGYSKDAVKKALESLMKSEALLRTTFVARGASFLQLIKKTAEIPWQTLEIGVREYMQQRASDLMYAGKLWWRVAALPGDILVVTTHHALFDYWSNEFLSHDLSCILLSKAPIQRPAFRRYVEHLQQYDDATMKTFWNNYLNGAKPSKLGPYISRETKVNAKLGFDLRGTASNLMVTPSVLLYAAWSVVLAITCSTDDVVFGVTLSGREAPVPGILEMNGPALMVVPLRIKVDKTNSFKDHLRSVQDSLWHVAKHAQYGLRNILKASRQPKDLIDSSVNFLIKLSSPTPPGGLVALPESNLGTVDNVKLELNNDSLDRVNLVSMLDSSLAQNLVDMVAIVLKASSSAPLTKIGQWKPTQPATKPSGALKDEDSNLHLMNGLRSQVQKRIDRFDSGDYASTMSKHRELAHAAFQRTAASQPARTAVQDACGNHITYAGLSIKVNQLAGLLKAKGVILEQVVPMILEKSINTVVAIFGILVAGGAFLPLGPENPRERNLGILEDLDGKLAITDRSNADFFVGTEYEIIIIDDMTWDVMPIERQIVPGLKPDSLAYVIYTSGSSGKPKGTLLTHEGLAVATEAIIEATKTDMSHRFLWAPNYTFDGSLDTLFTALSSGGTLCVAPQSIITSNLGGLINAMQANRVNMTPSMTTLINPEDVPTLKILITGGEAISTKLLDKWAQHVTIYNAYGPTEATICITTRPVEPGMNLRNVGSPFKNVTALILDPDTMAAMPDGCVGELCLSGPQLARGYLKRPDATAKAFHVGPNGRIYRTGDLARLLPNGDIELFGRKDDQVKINGYRIELGEIESVIANAHVFGQCVVITATVLKKKQLVAFYSRSVGTTREQERGLLLPPEQMLDVDQVKGQLTTMPNYMIPTIWLPVSKLPFSVAGKIDRKRLQSLVEGMDDGVLKEYLPKEEASEINSGTELTLQGLWSTLFETPMDEIHANSSFHAMGGDSISALNLVNMLRRHGYEIKVSDILSRNTLRQQAALIDESIKSDEAVVTASVNEMHYQPPDTVYERLSQIGVLQAEVEDIYPCSPGQIEFLTQGNKDDQFWQLMALRGLPDDLDFDRWIQLTTKLTQHNQILRTLYLCTERDNPQTAVQVVLKHPALNLDYQSFKTEEEKKQILETEWETRFDPAKPFVRYTFLVNEEDGTRHLLVKLDHASYDGTLLHIFDDQFKALDKNLPIPRHTPFKQFISHVVATPKQPQLDYWVRLLENQQFSFPSKLINPKLSKLETAQISISMGVDNLASSNGVTTPIVFQTAYSLLLAKLSGTRDVIYDNLITGRNVPIDNPQLIDGNCANFLPFYSHVAGDKSIEGLLKETQDAFWASTENGLVSLGEIYDALGLERSTSAAKCLFCFQPFEPAPVKQEPMRWIVMKMSKVRMHFNYAVQLEVVKAATKGEYVIRFGYDERAFTKDGAQMALNWYVECLSGMARGTLVEELGI